MVRIAWLFDVDGTLVDTTELHTSAYRVVYEKVTSHTIPDAIIKSRFGMAATKGHDQVFTAAGVPFSQQTIDNVVAEHQRVFAALMKKQDIKPLVGVVEFLSLLQQRKDVVGIVTGNFEQPAKSILQKAGLLHFFHFLSCDAGQDTRVAIVRRAMSLAQQTGSVDRCIVIGDTPSDIRAGKTAGVMTVGVATGFFPAQVLEQEGADIVVKSLQEYPALLKTFNS